MRAVVVDEPSGRWQVREVSLAAPGPGEVLVRVGAAGLCRTDFSLGSGGLPQRFPFVPGHEGVGTVLGTGPGVETVVPGDRVLFHWVGPCGACWFCRHEQSALCSAAVSARRTDRMRLPDGAKVQSAMGIGAFAEQALVSERSVVRFPSALPDTQAATLGCGVATGFGAARRIAGVAAGESVVVMGAGGVGLSVIQTSLALGAACVIAVDPSPERRDLALKFGAHAAHDPASALAKAVRDSTGGRGADHVFECVGTGPTIRQSWALARRGGAVTVVGAGATSDRVQFSAFELFHSGRILQGAVFGGFEPGRDLAQLCDFVESGQIGFGGALDVHRGLDRIDEAVDAFTSRRFARSVLVPDMP
ncbi:zinc-binding dehydrogenase [Streptomyces sp. NBC_01275]|uniref:zinc-binding dehydrogenase n=1 Tax=Streptomyces sp. NBC_01275 TaxID=2903807 RepID=UPI00225B187F|nr:zinc-binding dehydrogenase [Streptomyces sp. NBC_01275]MCX4763972.1 zinc-binding dehydrogenase [Streptomyces sp. NBC_01275]